MGEPGIASFEAGEQTARRLDVPAVLDHAIGERGAGGEVFEQGADSRALLRAVLRQRLGEVEVVEGVVRRERDRDLELDEGEVVVDPPGDEGMRGARACRRPSTRAAPARSKAGSSRASVSPASGPSRRRPAGPPASRPKASPRNPSGRRTSRAAARLRNRGERARRLAGVIASSRLRPPPPRDARSSARSPTSRPRRRATVSPLRWPVAYSPWNQRATISRTCASRLPGSAASAASKAAIASPMGSGETSPRRSPRPAARTPPRRAPWPRRTSPRKAAHPPKRDSRHHASSPPCRETQERSLRKSSIERKDGLLRDRASWRLLSDTEAWREIHSTRPPADLPPTRRRPNLPDPLLWSFFAFGRRWPDPFGTARNSARPICAASRRSPADLQAPGISPTPSLELSSFGRRWPDPFGHLETLRGRLDPVSPSGQNLNHGSNRQRASPGALRTGRRPPPPGDPRRGVPPLPRAGPATTPGMREIAAALA